MNNCRNALLVDAHDVPSASLEQREQCGRPWCRMAGADLSAMSVQQLNDQVIDKERQITEAREASEVAKARQGELLH